MTALRIYPTPSGWHAICHVPGCCWTARGHDSASVTSDLAEHQLMTHGTVARDDEEDDR